MDADVTDIVARIHDTPQQSVLAVAGAGNYALAWLLGVGGASRTVLETRVPYGYLAMTDFLGGYAPEQTVSADTARRMARAAWARGMSLREQDAPIVGLACTATIATDRTKRGDHRAFIATWDDESATTDAVVLEKGRRDRAGEEDVVSQAWSLPPSPGRAASSAELDLGTCLVGTPGNRNCHDTPTRCNACWTATRVGSPSIRTGAWWWTETRRRPCSPARSILSTPATLSWRTWRAKRWERRLPTNFRCPTWISRYWPPQRYTAA